MWNRARREGKRGNLRFYSAEKNTLSETSSPLNFFEDNNNNTNDNNSLFSDDVEWNQFINNSSLHSPKPSKPTSTYLSSSPLLHNNKTNGKSPQKTPKNNNAEHFESMDYDIGNVDSPMHMTDWLASAPPSSSLSSFPLDDLDETEPDILFPPFSSHLPNPKQEDRRGRSPQKTTNKLSIFSTPADEPYELRWEREKCNCILYNYFS